MRYTTSGEGDAVSDSRAILTELRQMTEARGKDLSRQETPVIGWCCSYVPIEILESAGLVPFRVLPFPPVEMGDAYLNPNFCPYVRAIMGEGLVGTYPFLSGLIIVNTCDGMRRLYDGWFYFHDLPFLHLMDLPRITTPAGVRRFREEIESLAERVFSHFGAAPTRETMKACLEISNRTRMLMQQIQHLTIQGRLDLPASELIELFKAGGVLPRSQYDLLLERVVQSRDGGHDRTGTPVLLTGAMLENTAITSMIEEAGGRVVLHDLCVSGRQPEDLVSLTEDPLTALARHYLLRPPCARMEETERRIEYILGLIRQGRVRGVIYYVLKFCDTFLYEAPVLRKKLDDLGIPMLTIESEYRQGRGGGVQTRIQAFMEMLNDSGTP
jgi:benzoyl-CoA reductase/2-hydroxyglutaryl-CoA dehydratase subunit BcrC/BadD/HgdB